MSLKRLGLFLPPDPPPSVQVFSINDQLVETHTAAARQSAIRLSRLGPSKVTIEAHFIPPGTVVELELYTEDSNAHMVRMPPLEGTFEASQATVTVEFPKGVSSADIKADWDRSKK